MREQEFPVTREWGGFNHRESAQITSQWQSQYFVLSVRDGRLRPLPHFYDTIVEIDTVLEALP